VIKRARNYIARLFLMVLFAPSIVAAADPVGDFADFLIDRANDNYVYFFQVYLRENPFMATYLPETLRVAQSTDLRGVLPNRDLWRQTIEEDIERTLSKRLEDRFAPLLTRLCAAIEFPDSGVALKDIWGYASLPSGEKWTKAIKVLKATCEKDTAAMTSGLSSNSLQAAIKKELSAGEEFTKADLKAAVEPPFPSYLIVLRGTPDERIQFILASLSKVVDKHTEAKKRCSNVHRGLYALCAIALADFVEAAAHAVSDLSGQKCESNLAYDCGNKGQVLRFRRYIVFFAQLADLDEKQPVSSAMLKSVTVPAVSFGAKREPEVGLWSISSYFALSVGSTKNATSQSEESALNRYGSLFVPVGLEWSWGNRDRTSNSILVSALDFGNVVTQKLTGTYTGASLPNVVAPGVFYVRGFRDSPLAAGLGVERVSTGLAAPSRETRVLVFLGFDMPLLMQP